MGLNYKKPSCLWDSSRTVFSRPY